MRSRFHSLPLFQAHHAAPRHATITKLKTPALTTTTANATAT